PCRDGHDARRRVEPSHPGPSAGPSGVSRGGSRCRCTARPRARLERCRDGRPGGRLPGALRRRSGGGRRRRRSPRRSRPGHRRSTMTVPTPPIELTGTASRFAGEPEPLPSDLRARLDELAATGVCTVSDDLVATAEASRDWWPLALYWSLAGQVPRRAAALVRPTTTDAVARVVAACNAAHVPVTAAGG